MTITYDNAVSWLYSHINMEAIANPGKKDYKYDINHLSDWFNPQGYKPKILHIAGTKGKGSVCMLLEKTLRENGYTTGLYTSPHLYRVNERVRLQGQPLSDLAFIEMLKTISTMQEKLPLSFFEIMTIAALRYFALKNVDWVILETGLGGRLDSTNIVKPFATILTKIDYDHMNFLGNTLEKIAGEKAGIIKENTPCIALEQSLEVNQVFTATALSKNAPLCWVQSNQQNKENFEIVKRTITFVNDNLKTEIKTNENLDKTCLPGRFEIFKHKEKTIILDVAHNPISFQYVQNKLKEHRIENPVILLASAKDKDLEGSAKIIKKISNTIFVPALSFPRMAPPSQMQEHYPQAIAFKDFEKSIKTALLDKNPNILIMGSFHLIEEAGIFFKRNALY